MKLNKSKELFEIWEKIVPGGVHSNVRYQPPHPIYFQKARGPYLWDVDGNKWIDCISMYGACILGHGDPDIETAVMETIRSGITSGLETELSLMVAGQLHWMVPSAEKVRFEVSGTGAVMKALQIAREFTGRGKVVKAEGAYHGTYDEMNVSSNRPRKGARQPNNIPIPVEASGGLRPGTKDLCIVIPYNDTNVAVELIEQNKHDIAAVIIEPFLFNTAVIAPEPGYLEALREVTRKYGIVYIFDEVITGFRMAPGGAQERYGITPDLTVFAKAIANGYPLAAVVGRGDIMGVSDPKSNRYIYGGTYNSNYLALAAASASLSKLEKGEIQKNLQKAGKMLKEKALKAAKDLGVNDLQIHEESGKFQFLFATHKVKDYWSACAVDIERYHAFQKVLWQDGIYSRPAPFFHHSLTAAHDDKAIDGIVGSVKKGLKEISTKQQENNRSQNSRS